MSPVQNANGGVHVTEDPSKTLAPIRLLYHHEDGPDRTTFLRKRRQAPTRLRGVTTRKIILKGGFHGVF
jgi:hypothetical protein